MRSANKKRQARHDNASSVHELMTWPDRHLCAWRCKAGAVKPAVAKVGWSWPSGSDLLVRLGRDGLLTMTATIADLCTCCIKYLSCRLAATTSTPFTIFPDGSPRHHGGGYSRCSCVEETGCLPPATVAEISVGQMVYHDDCLHCGFHCRPVLRLDGREYIS